MGAPAKDRDELLLESEETLRQVRSVLDDLGTKADDGFGEVDRMVADLEDRPSSLQDLMRVLTRTYAEIVEVIDSLRKSRGLLEQAAMERLQRTHAKLAEVTSATEVAAVGMLDGLDRALVLVDQLEAADQHDEPESGGEPEKKTELRSELREELHQLMNLLQFQDITAQQLGYASGVLLDIEERMVRLAKVFDLRGLGFEEDDPAEKRDHCHVEQAKGTCDPEASTFEADTRQALADEIFT